MSKSRSRDSVAMDGWGEASPPSRREAPPRSTRSIPPVKPTAKEKRGKAEASANGRRMFDAIWLYDGSAGTPRPTRLAPLANPLAVIGPLGPSSLLSFRRGGQIRGLNRVGVGMGPNVRVWRQIFEKSRKSASYGRDHFTASRPNQPCRSVSSHS